MYLDYWIAIHNTMPNVRVRGLDRREVKDKLHAQFGKCYTGTFELPRRVVHHYDTSIDIINEMAECGGCPEWEIAGPQR